MNNSLLQTARDNRIKALQELAERRERELAQNNILSLDVARRERRNIPVFRSIRETSLFMEYDVRQAA